MKDKQLKAWEIMRAKGKLNFFLINGILSYGVPMLILMAFMNKPFANGFISLAAIVHVIVWLLAGLFFGIIMWYMTEYKYKKALANRT
ncbi:MAG: hypothetical protein OCD00_18650 [Colwellia sp.]